VSALVSFSTILAIHQSRHADVVDTLVGAIAGSRTRLAVVQEAIAVHAGLVRFAVAFVLAGSRARVAGTAVAARAAGVAGAATLAFGVPTAAAHREDKSQSTANPSHQAYRVLLLARGRDRAGTFTYSRPLYLSPRYERYRHGTGAA
jgi:hypothetical protein